MSSSKIFLFTCVKNGTHWIKKLFDSLLNQTSTNFIHYIYDDGSTDNISDLVDEYKQRVKFLKNPFEIIFESNPKNIGLNKATEHCLHKAIEYPYFGWINCDDYLDKNYVKEMQRFIKLHPHICIYRSRMILHYNNRIEVRPNGHMERYLFKKRYQKKNLLLNNFSYNHFLVNSKEFLTCFSSINLIKDKTIFNDVQILFPLAYHNYSFAYVKKAVSNYLVRNDSVSFENNENPNSFSTIMRHLRGDVDDSFCNFIEIFKKNKTYCLNFYDSLQKKDFQSAKVILNERATFLKKNRCTRFRSLICGKTENEWKLYFLYKTLKGN